MDSGQRGELLKLVRSGHDTEAAAAKLGIDMAEVRKGGAKLQRELADAFSTASARLRAKLLEGALDGNDMRLLGEILQSRERVQADAAADGELAQIQIHVIEPACPSCGYRPNGQVRGLPRDAPAPEPAEEPESAKPAKQPYTRQYGPSVRMGGI